MSALAARGPRALQAKTKSSSKSTTNITTDSDRKERRSHKRARGADIDSDAATTAFVRRVLCASHARAGTTDTTKRPLEELLPPLTSSNDIDLQLYAIIAVIIKHFVQSWYAQITPDDHFVEQIVQVIAHCSRGLEQRFRAADLEILMLVELPAVLNSHAEGVYRLCGRFRS